MQCAYRNTLAKSAQRPGTTPCEMRQRPMPSPLDCLVHRTTSHWRHSPLHTSSSTKSRHIRLPLLLYNLCSVYHVDARVLLAGIFVFVTSSAQAIGCASANIMGHAAVLDSVSADRKKMMEERRQKDKARRDALYAKMKGAKGEATSGTPPQSSSPARPRVFDSTHSKHLK